jgi:hypothetical protein
MSRYQALRLCGCSPITSAFVACLNHLFGVPKGVIVFLTIAVEYEP